MRVICRHGINGCVASRSSGSALTALADLQQADRVEDQPVGQDGAACLARLGSSRSAFEACGEVADVVGEFGWVEDLEINADRGDVDRDLAIPVAAR